MTVRGAVGLSAKRCGSLLAFVLVIVPAAQAQFYPARPVPPADSPALLRSVELRAPTQGDVFLRDGKTYVDAANGFPYRSVPLEDRWGTFDEAAPQILADAERFWRSGQFDSLWVDVRDQAWRNGVTGRHVIFNFVERADTVVPTATYPTPPPEYDEPPAEHERLYPPPEQ
jgi:hypothetical protein